MQSAAVGPCQTSRHVKAKRRKKGRPPLFIGDSTGLLASPFLAAEGITANARGCRQFSEALQILHREKRAHRLPRVVLIALGANGPIPPGGIGRALELIDRKGKLVLVTPGRSAFGSLSVIRAAGRAHRKRIKVFDWARYGRRHGLLGGDGLHISVEGAKRFARYLKPALKYAR